MSRFHAPATVSLAVFLVSAAFPAAAATPPLYDNLGSWHHPISSRSKEAARYFDQGLRLVYAFNHDEAEAAFRAAADADTGCAICWWGVALTLGPNINLPAMPDRMVRAYTAIRKAKALEGRAAPGEKALIDALDRRYSDPPPADATGQKALDLAYAAAMREVAHRYPDDPDAQTLFAESLMDLSPWDHWTKDGQPRPATVELIATLEKVLAHHPDHPGANHYYIHAMEASPHPEQALAAAERLPGLMPGAGHIVHMPAHIYERTGRYEEASQANRNAIRADSLYLNGQPPRGFYGMYVAHNFQFLAHSAMLEGRSAEAVEAGRRMAESMPPDLFRNLPPGSDYFMAWPWFAMLRFGRWGLVLNAPEPPPDFKAARAMWHYARGVAYVATARRDEARDELKALIAVRDSLPDSTMTMMNRSKGLVIIGQRVLTARIEAAEAGFDQAAAELAEAVRLEDGLHYDEPPDWFYPVRHTLGAVLLGAGRGAQAEAVYRADLKVNPGNGWALFGLAQSLRLQHKDSEAAEVQEQFQKAWKNADFTPKSSDE